MKQTGDGVLATFDGPARGIECAAAIRNGAHQLGIEVRAGLHTHRAPMCMRPALFDNGSGEVAEETLDAVGAEIPAAEDVVLLVYAARSPRCFIEPVDEPLLSFPRARCGRY